MAELTVVRDVGAFHGLRDGWDELWRSDPEATPFQSPEWLLPWWNQFGEGELRVGVIRIGGTLAGILPCYIYREPGTGLRRLLPVGISTSDYLGGAFAPDLTIDAIGAGMDLLRCEPGWDELSFPQLRPECRLAQALGAAGLVLAPGESTSRIPAVPIAGLPQKIRHNVANYRNRALRIGRVEMTTASEESWPAAFDALCTLHSRRWRESREPGVLADPRVLAWHRELLPGMLRAGTARLSSLRLEGQTIGVLYSLVDPPGRARRTQYCYLIGFSTEYAELSPGTLLLALVAEQAAREGIAELDLLRGDEPYKQLWHPERITPVSAFGPRECATQRK